MQSAEDLMMARLVQKNILATTETLSLCTPVLQQYCKLNEQMDKKQYYSALKTLEQLEHTFLPPVRGYIFSDLLCKEIPKIRKSIEDQSNTELTDFLAKVRESSVIIGEVAMHQAQKHAYLEIDLDVKQLLDKDKEIDSEACAQDLVDFSPVYRCLHIHSVLGKRESFMENYRNQRRMQVRLAIKPHGSWKGQIDDFKRFFYGIVGFFVVEDTILHTTQSLTVTGSKVAGGEGLVTRKIVHEFWGMAQDEVLAVLRNTCGSCSEYDLLLKVKQLVVWFCTTLRGYGFEVDKLYEVLLEIREQYDELLMKAWGSAFTDIFERDDYTPSEVLTDAHYQGVLETFPYHDKDLAAAEFPKRFPFSSMVFQVYEQLKNFVIKCNSYSLRLNLSQTEIDECVRKSVNLLLTRTMTSCLNRLVHKESLAVPQLVQIWVNIDHLERSMGELEKFISRTTKSDSERVTAGKLFGASTFKDARQLSEVQITEKLDKKMTEIMAGVAYDWTPKDPITVKSDFIRDLLVYLEFIFSTFDQIPESVTTDVYFKTFNRLASKLEEMLNADEIERISLHGFKSFSVDVQACERFLKSTHSASPGLQRIPGSSSVFKKLNETLDLFLTGEWSDYVNNFSAPSRKYRTVTPSVVHGLLFRLRESMTKKKKLFGHKSSSQKEELKYYEMLLRNLESLAKSNMANDLLRQSGKTKKRIKFKKRRKDEMKLAILKLKSIVQQDQTDGGTLAEGYNTPEHEQSGSDQGSITGEAKTNSPKL